MRRFRLLLSVVVAVLLTAINASGQQAREPAEVRRGQLQRVIEVQERYTRQLVSNPLVFGTGVSVDQSGRGMVKVFTRAAGVRGVPRRLEGIDIVVEEMEPFMALHTFHAGTSGGTAVAAAAFDTTARYRPAPVGVSTGHPDITAGTIGARVKDVWGNVYALSNNHVYANVNAASIGDNVLQPGAFDGGIDPDDAFGTLWDFVPLKPGIFQVNVVDAAIALSSAGELDNATPPDGYGVPRSQPVAARVNMPVMKYGRTTRLTKGRISAINVFTIVGYGPDYYLWFDRQILISGSGFSGGGDSGSLVVAARGAIARRPVGLLFAGNSTTTLANPIGAVLNQLGVTIDGEG
jgi:hypothetical protein